MAVPSAADFFEAMGITETEAAPDLRAFFARELKQITDDKLLKLTTGLPVHPDWNYLGDQSFKNIVLPVPNFLTTIGIGKPVDGRYVAYGDEIVLTCRGHVQLKLEAWTSIGPHTPLYGAVIDSSTVEKVEITLTAIRVLGRTTWMYTVNRFDYSGKPIHVNEDTLKPLPGKSTYKSDVTGKGITYGVEINAHITNGFVELIKVVPRRA